MVLGPGTSISATCENKMRVSGACRSEYERIRRDTRNERYARSDETWWPVVEKVMSRAMPRPKKRNPGYVIHVLRKNHSHARVSKSRSIAELKKTLLDYQGKMISDLYLGWLHIRRDHQTCAVYQIRPIKKDPKYKKNLDGEARAFLEALLKTFKKISGAGKLADQEDQIVAADGMDAKIAELFGRDYADSSKTASKCAKRYRKKVEFYTTHLRDESGGGGTSQIICRETTTTYTAWQKSVITAP